MDRKKAQSIQVCIATMQNSPTLLDKMNIRTDFIVGNQCEYNRIESFSHRGCSGKWLSFQEKGVGLNRNNALMRATADIVIFADDDMVFDDNYERKILEVFNANPKADVVIFNIKEKDGKRKIITKKHYTKKIGYGAARIAVRREVVSMNNIFFNQNFGGGSRFSCGEDTIFLSECVRKGLRILCVPDAIATLNNDRPSTWFKGYNDKYYFDKGVLLAASRISFPYIRMLKFSLQTQDQQKTSVEIFKICFAGYRFFKHF